MVISLFQPYSFCQMGQRSNQEDCRLPDADTMLHVGDKVRFVGDLKNEKTLLLLGPKTEVVWEEKEKNIHLVSHHIVVTKPKINGKRIADLKVREAFNITITLAFVCFHGNGCLAAHIGDSRIYQIRQ